MQKTLDINISTYLKKYWFQLAIIGIALYVIASKDLSFQFNINNPEIENAKEVPGKAEKGAKKKSQELITANHKTSKVAKSEASFFSKIPFIGSGNSNAPKKSELPKIDDSTIDFYIKRFAHVAINERKNTAYLLLSL